MCLLFTGFLCLFWVSVNNSLFSRQGVGLFFFFFFVSFFFSFNSVKGENPNAKTLLVSS